jgi:hypothetical protein
MNSHRPNNSLEIIYYALAIAGLIGTWAQVFGYLQLGFFAGTIQFWQETVATPASSFIMVDIIVLAAAVFVLMFAEGRRLGIGAGWLWTYYLGSTLVGISCFVPLYLAHRQRVLRARHPEQNVSPHGMDWLAIGLALLLGLAAVAYSLLHIPA